VKEVFMGVDVGRRIDASALVLTDRDSESGVRRVLYCKEGFRWDYLTTVTQVKKIAEHIKPRLIAVDSTGMGDPVYEMLAYQDTGGKALGSVVANFWFTNELKYKMMTNTISLLEQKKLKINPEFRKLLNQMRLQKYEVRQGRIVYMHPSSGGTEEEGFSFHDDLLWAMNLALWADYNTPIHGREAEFLGYRGGSRRKGLLEVLKRIWRVG